MFDEGDRVELTKNIEVYVDGWAVLWMNTRFRVVRVYPDRVSLRNDATGSRVTLPARLLRRV